jgi:acetyl-CoA carboxylase biotin carboxyl carrier protein
MTAKDFAQKAAIGGTPDALAGADRTGALREEIVELARALPGDLRRLIVRSGDRAIEVEWAPEAAALVDGSRPTTRAGAALRPDAPPDVPPGPVPEVPEGIDAVRAPLVGTFYVAPTPGSDPFVQVGDEVEPGQTLAIVEAMKLMNPIVADGAGVVTEVLVGDAESVEYDQALILMRPTGRPR